MSTAIILTGALAMIESDGLGFVSREAVPALLLTCRRMWCSIAPRCSAVRRLDQRLLALVVSSPTAWCTADLRVVSLGGSLMRRVPGAFPQLRRIEVSGFSTDRDALAPMLRGVGASGTIREIILWGSVSVTDAVLEAIAPVVGRLETLTFDDCPGVTGSMIAKHLQGMRRLRAFAIGDAERMTDDHLTSMLADSPELESLTVRDAPELTGAFLAALPEEFYAGMHTLAIIRCRAFNDAGAAHLPRFTGLESMSMQECPLVSSLRLPRMRVACDFFLCQSMTLHSIDAAGLEQVTVVGRNFIAYCPALATLDLSAMKNVVSVADGFLDNCNTLSRLRLSDALLRHPAVDDKFKRLHAQTGCDGGWQHGY